MAKITEGACITVKNAILAPSEINSQPVLNINKGTEITKTSNPCLKVKDSLLSNNLSFKSRPPNVCVCIGGPDKIIIEK